MKGLYGKKRFYFFFFAVFFAGAFLAAGFFAAAFFAGAFFFTGINITPLHLLPLIQAKLYFHIAGKINKMSNLKLSSKTMD